MHGMTGTRLREQRYPFPGPGHRFAGSPDSERPKAGNRSNSPIRSAEPRDRAAKGTRFRDGPLAASAVRHPFAGWTTPGGRGRRAKGARDTGTRRVLAAGCPIWQARAKRA